MTAFPIDGIRADTTGTAEGIYFNAAGAGLMPRPVVDTIVRHLELEARVGGYEAADREAAALAHLYDATAALLQCSPAEIAIVESATRAWQAAFYAQPFAPGDRILTSDSEYGSNYMAMLQVAERHDVIIDVIPPDTGGAASIDAAREMLDDRVKLIALTHVPSNGGLVNPAAAFGALARQHDIPFLLDACQSVGQMEIDVEAIGCTMLTATSRKFLRGPRGAGFLYVRGEYLDRLEPACVDIFAASWSRSENAYDWRPDAKRFEAWESSQATRLGLAAAIDYALELSVGAIGERARSLAASLRRSLDAIPRVTVRDLGGEQSAIVTFTMDGMAAEQVRLLLRNEGIAVTTSGPGSAPLDMQRRELDALVRASPHYYNTEDEVTRFAEAVRRIAS